MQSASSFLGGNTPGPSSSCHPSLRAVLAAWRVELAQSSSLGRAYLFTRVLHDAELLRRSADQALPFARWIAPSSAQVRRPWWTGLLPDPAGGQGRGRGGYRDKLAQLLAEQEYWHRVEDLPTLSGLEELSSAGDASWGPGAALRMAKLAALLREGPDGHASLALAELATGNFAKAERRIIALDALDWQRSSDDPERVRQHLALGRAVLADQRGDLKQLRLELTSLVEWKRCPQQLWATLYILALGQGDDDSLEALRDVPPSSHLGATAMLRDLPVARWSASFGQGARLRVARALESEASPWLEIAQVLQGLQETR